MMTNKGWMIVCLLLTLLAGTSAGVVADRVVLKEEPKPVEERPKTMIHFTCEEGELDRPEGYYDERRAKMLTSWEERFSMTQEQVVALDAIIEEHGALAGDFWGETRDRYCSLRDALRAEINTTFDAEQQEQFEAYLEERRARRERRSSGGAANGSFF